MAIPAAVFLRLQRLQQRCGCVAGSFATLLALGYLCFYLYTHFTQLTFYKVMLHGIAGVFAALLIGLLAKLAALAVTQLQIRYLRWKYQIT